MWWASGGRIPLKEPPDATIAVGLFPRRLKQIASAPSSNPIVIQPECLLERRREGGRRGPCGLCPVDADLAPVEVHVGELEGYQFADAHSCVEQRLDQHQVAWLARSPDRLVVPTDQFFAGYVAPRVPPAAVGGASGPCPGLRRSCTALPIQPQALSRPPNPLTE